MLQSLPVEVTAGNNLESLLNGLFFVSIKRNH